MKKIAILVLLFCANDCFSQMQGNIWYFGDHAGIDFSLGNPYGIGGGQTYFVGGTHNEGTASICDNQGNLLFYTNGEKIWDRNHTVMPNGDSLSGGASSSQSSLIVPQPGSSRYFYVFTTDDFFQHQLAGGFRYSIVDMCLNNGNGDVVPGEKDILKNYPVAEKLTAVRHGNGTDYWIIVHKYYSDAFLAYHLTSTGIFGGSIVSNVGSVHPQGSQIGTGAAIGQLKASPSGNKLALVTANDSNNIAEYFDFDINTGVVSNCVNIQSDPNYNYYGVSFSPDNSKLYITGCLNFNGIYQFDLNAGGGHPDSVRDSRTNITTLPYNFWGLQLGKNGRIYVTHKEMGGFPWLSAINNPNVAGTGCNYVEKIVNLGGRDASYGLPNFIDSYDYSNTVTDCIDEVFTTTSQSICPGTCTDFLNQSSFATSFQWYFPGASPDTSTAEKPSNICYNTPGSYDVTLIASSASDSDTLTIANYITVYPFPPPQAILQIGDTLFANAGAVTYQWYHDGNILPGATDLFYVFSEGGDYNVICTDTNDCEVEAAINDVIGIEEYFQENIIKVYPNPVLEILSVNSSSLTGAADDICIHNVLGEKVMAVTTPSFGEGPGVEVNVSELPSGTYFIEIISNNKIYRAKFLKQ